ncbi:hypothetical protein DAEQUDRAFT_815000 [Daedalea quercina L-15889]|uniref:Nucleotidyltransferase family protein n=1 Tax=Daedalea quercina L-15889 TaxID=1314783 RepID=A0A165LG77_9APHY|nr:hypothetical protein DAEQUDRAFT_815000 [Daedalea quercina L-15889]
MKLLTSTQTSGDVFTDKLRKDVSAHLTGILAQAGIGPIILWGEWAMLYYGVPVSQNHIHILVPDDQLEIAYKTLLEAGYRDSPQEFIPPVNSLDPNLRWEELGCPAYRVVATGNVLNGPVLIQNYSAAGGIFGEEDLSLFEQCAGLSIPPLSIIAQSFLRMYFKLAASKPKSRTRSMLGVWCAYVKFYGYSPLGTEAMSGVPGIDDAMVQYWERGY